METASDRSIRLLGPCRVRELVMFTQLLALMLIIVSSLLNLSLSDSHRELFVALLSWAAGVLLPSPHEFHRRRSGTYTQEQHS